MKRVTLIAAAMVLAVLAVLTTRVVAQETNTQERSFLTFSNTVEMPGVTLPAGTYVFRLADTPSRNVVQVLSKDEKDILGQWTFVQAERPKVAEETVVMFKENHEGAAPAVQYWYFPGERIGKEFIYPKAQATKIAERTGQSVLSDEGRVSGTVASTDAQGNVTDWQREGNANQSAANSSADTQNSTLRNAPAAAQPSAAAGSTTGNRGLAGDNDHDADDVAQSAQANVNADRNRAVGTSGQSDTQASAPVTRESTQARNELPRTASPAPLVGLIGLLSLAGALGTRRYSTARR